MYHGYRSGHHVMRKISITLAVLCVLAGIVLALILPNIYINESNIKVLRVPFTNHIIPLEEIPTAEPTPLPEQTPADTVEVFHPEEGTSYQERIERAVLLPYHIMFDTKAVDAFLASISGTSVNTIVIEAKPANGKLNFVSSSELAGEANAESNDPLLALKTKLENSGYAVIVSVSCFRDNTIPRNNESLGLKNRDGALWGDAMRYTWLDPYSEDSHVYLITLISDLYKLGFREILLTNLSYPIAEDSDLIVYPNGKDAISEKEARIDQFLFQLAGFSNGLTDLSLSARFENAEGQTPQGFVNFFYRLYLPITPGEGDQIINEEPILALSPILGEGTLSYRLVPTFALAERTSMETLSMVRETSTYGTGYFYESPDGIYDPVLFQTQE